MPGVIRLCQKFSMLYFYFIVRSLDAMLELKGFLPDT